MNSTRDSSRETGARQDSPAPPSTSGTRRFAQFLGRGMAAFKRSTVVKFAVGAVVAVGVVLAAAAANVAEKPSASSAKTEPATPDASPGPAAPASAAKVNKSPVRVEFVAANWSSGNKSYGPQLFKSEGGLARDVQSRITKLVSEGYRITAVFPTTRGEWSGNVTSNYSGDEWITGGVGYGQTSGVIIVAQR